LPLVVKVACPACGCAHDAVSLGATLRCHQCGHDFKAQADGEGASRVISATPAELDRVPYSQRAVEQPVNGISSVIVGDPALLTDKLLRDAPVRENAKWLGKVRLIKKLGVGGMGAVYHGYDDSLALDVAVKIMPLPSARDEQFVQRFRQEARISAQIKHPNVVRTIHVDEQGEIIFLVMDFVAGQTARQLVDAKGPLNVPLALQIIHDATLGMQAAHEHQVIHRDIKPENILVADDGRVLLSDLGLAKALSTSGPGSRLPVTRMGLLLGTPEYMSPEQWDIGAVAGPASDVWSMGATLWMLLTQKPPFDEKDLSQLARLIKDAPLPDIREMRPEIPDCVLDILDCCLAKKPEDRFDDAGHLLKGLEAALDQIAEGKATVSPRPKKPEKPEEQFSLDELRIQNPKSKIQNLAIRRPQSTVFKAPSQSRALKAPSQVWTAPEIIEEQTPTAPKSRRVWVAGCAALLALTLWAALPRFFSRSAPTPATIALRLQAPPVIKAGQEAQLHAELGTNNAAAYAVVWHSQDRAWPGTDVSVPLEADTEFTVVVREKSTTREVARQQVKVVVDLGVRAAERDFYEVPAGTPLRLEGRVRGGGDSRYIETRWVELGHPDRPLAKNASLDLLRLRVQEGTVDASGKKTPRMVVPADLNDDPALDVQDSLPPGRYIFALQARRVDPGATPMAWQDCAKDKVTVLLTRRMPPEYKMAMQLAAQTRGRAQMATSGAAAVASWREALAAFEKAAEILQTDDVAQQVAQCKQQLEAENRYAVLLLEVRRLRETAEAVPLSDGLRRLAAWSEALRPCTGALVLFDRPEIREQTAVVEARLKELRASLENAQQDRAAFDGKISQARQAAKEAKKYLSPAVALPYWETALAAFLELSKRYPQRAEEFALELKECQENRDKTYLHETLGVVPVAPVERSTEIKSPTPAPKPPEKEQPKTAPVNPAPKEPVKAATKPLK
jgi:serine/threonine protein kinase